MKPISLNALSLALGLLFILTEGCTHKDLNEEAHTTIAEHLEVVFDWKYMTALEGDGFEKPSTMMLYLYSPDHEVMDYSFNNPDGGVIRAYGGQHTALCHSNDDPYVHHIRNHHSHDDFEIFTDDAAILVGQGISTRGIPRAPGAENEPLRTTPTRIFATHERDVDIKVSALPQTLVLYPEPLVCRYRVEFVDVENLQNGDVRVDATISSLAGGYFPGRMAPSSEAVSQTFTLSPDLDSGSLQSEFLTFGVPDGEEKPHMISIYIALRNRQGNFYTFDVSDQVNKAPDPRNVTIRIHGLKLPEIPDDPPTPPQGEGGISIEVDNWETYHYNLKV